jgi:cob(I)alamin adenosyltransferase
MTIYTRTGDQGETDLLGGVRVPKDTLALEVCGDLDELNSLLGLVRCETLSEGVDTLLDRLQRQLFDVGGQLVTIAAAPGTAKIGASDVRSLERTIDDYEVQLPPLATFVLPGGTRAATTLHLARAVSRRVERRLVTLAKQQSELVSHNLLAYVNRLSDVLFVLARLVNWKAGIIDPEC